MQKGSSRLHRAGRVFMQSGCGVIAAILLLTACGMLRDVSCGRAAIFTLIAAAASAGCAALTEC